MSMSLHQIFKEGMEAMRLDFGSYIEYLQHYGYKSAAYETEKLLNRLIHFEFRSCITIADPDFTE